MNYTAYQIIKEEMGSSKGKWIALMGNCHVRNYKTVPGVADMTGARAVYIFDINKKPDEQNKTKQNKTKQNKTKQN